MNPNRLRLRRSMSVVVVAIAILSVGLAPAQAQRERSEVRRPDRRAEMLRSRASAAVDAAALLPAGFQDTVAIDGLTEPIAVAFSPDGRVFVAEKSGLIKAFDGLDDPSATVFADLSTNVYNFFDRGLMSIRLAPNFPADPYLYALYAYDGDIGGPAPKWGTPGDLSDPCPNPPGATADGCVISGRLSRMRADGSSAGAEQVLLNGWCQQFPSHSLGDIAFAPDGALYVTGGDGASFGFADYGQEGQPLNPCGDPPAGVGGVQSPPTAEGGALRSQDIRTTGDPTGYNGALLRLNPATGAAFPNNPLVGGSDTGAARIVAYGLRNAFRVAFRPGTDDLWIGDVGWTRYEEIDVHRSPAAPLENYGWPCYEGPLRQPQYDGLDLNLCEQLYPQSNAHTAPVFSYRRSDTVAPDDGCSTGTSTVSAMAFYEGGSYPDAYDGALFFGDYSRGCFWVMFPNAAGDPDPATRAGFLVPAQFPVDLEVGPAGDLFYVDIVGGAIRRITFSSGNQAPTAVAEASPTFGPVPLTVDFDGRGSSDPDGDTLTYAWDLDGDGQFDDSTSPTPSRTYTTAGTVAVRLRVQDPAGATGTDALTIAPGDAPPNATIESPSPSTLWSVGEVIDFSGSAVDARDGTLPPSALSWSLTLHHCPSGCHEHHIQDFVGSSGSFVGPDHEYPSHLELQLVATDSSGLQDVETVLLDPRTVQLTFQTDPTGLEIVAGGDATPTPFTLTATVGSTNTVSAPSPQSDATGTFLFTRWSDGGAQSHDIIAPSSNTTYTATFQPVAPTEVSVSDFDFTPSTLLVDHGSTVVWTFEGPSAHTVNDRTGMNLYDSGPRSPGASFAFTFFGAGSYTYRCSIHTTMRGTVRSQMDVAPARGSTTTSYQVEWATVTAPAGFVFDVQIRRPNASYVDWRGSTTLSGDVFVPDAGAGRYQFRARLRSLTNGRTSGYSPAASIRVS